MCNYRMWSPICGVPPGQAPCNSQEGTSGDSGSSTAFWILLSLCLVEDLESKRPDFPNLVGHRIFFFFPAKRLASPHTSGSPAPLSPSVAEISLIKPDGRHWHFLLLLHQVNLCFDQFVYKLADQIFAYYKAMAGRYESPRAMCSKAS